MGLDLVTAGESHGPALLAVLTGLPAGLRLDRAAIDADLRRRQLGYGRSPRQQLETDTVEVLSGLRHAHTLGTPLTLVVRNLDHKNWTWGMSPWEPEGEPHGKGVKAVTLPRPGHADLAGVLKYGHDDVRNALERASARHTATHVAAGAVAKALLATIGITVAGRPLEVGGARGDDGMREATDAARKRPRHARRGRRGRRRGLSARPRLVRREGRPARRQARVRPDGDPGRQRASRSATASRSRVFAAPRHTTRSIRVSRAARTMRAGSKPGITNGEPVVVRAAMKPLPTLMKPLDSVDLDTGEAAQALVERSDVQAVEALAVVAEAAVAWQLARSAKDKFGGDAIVDFVASPSRLPRAHPVAANALNRHLALAGFMGAGKTTLGEQVARRLRRHFVDLDHEIERRTGATIDELFARDGEAGFREIEATRRRVRARLRPSPTVIALGGGAVLSADTRERFAGVRSPCCSTSIRAPPGSGRVRARGRSRSTRRRSRRSIARVYPSTRTPPTPTHATPTGSRSPPPGIDVRIGAIDLLGELVPGSGRSRSSPTRTSPASTASQRSSLSAPVTSPRTTFRRARPPRRSRCSNSSGGRCGSGETGRSSVSEAVARPTSSASRRRRTCEASPGSRCRRLSSARSTRRSAARPPSTSREERISSARSTGRRASSSTPACSRPCPRRSTGTGWRRS